MLTLISFCFHFTVCYFQFLIFALVFGCVGQVRMCWSSSMCWADWAGSDVLGRLDRFGSVGQVGQVRICWAGWAGSDLLGRLGRFGCVGQVGQFGQVGFGNLTILTD